MNIVIEDDLMYLAPEPEPAGPGWDHFRSPFSKVGTIYPFNPLLFLYLLPILPAGPQDAPFAAAPPLGRLKRRVHRTNPGGADAVDSQGLCSGGGQQES